MRTICDCHYEGKLPETRFSNDAKLRCHLLCIHAGESSLDVFGADLVTLATKTSVFITARSEDFDSPEREQIEKDLKNKDFTALFESLIQLKKLQQDFYLFL